MGHQCAIINEIYYEIRDSSSDAFLINNCISNELNTFERHLPIKKFFTYKELYLLKKFHSKTQPYSGSKHIAVKLGNEQEAVATLSCECSCSLFF